MTSIERKMKLVKDLFREAKPIRQTFYTTFVYGYGPSYDYEGDDEYLNGLLYGVPGQVWEDY